MAYLSAPYVAPRPDNNTLTIHTSNGSPFAFTFDSNVALNPLRSARPLEGGLTQSNTVCGKRSRSNSTSTSPQWHLMTSSTGPASQTSSQSSDVESTFDINDCLNLSPSTSPSSGYTSSQDISNMSESDDESDAVRRVCHSPSAGSRKAIRCKRADMACRVVSPPSSQRASSVPISPIAAPLVAAIAPAAVFPSQMEPETLPVMATSNTAVASVGGERSSFVDHLVDAAVCTLESIWPDVNSAACTATTTAAQGLPLRYFVRETLRRSRTSCSTLQTALLYCVRAGPAIRELRTQNTGDSAETSQDVSSLSLVSLDISGTGPMRASSPPLPSVSNAVAAASSSPSAASSPLHCARRTFLSSLILSSKFLQDKTYSLRAWSKISGLGVKELAHIERTLLRAVGYSLKVDEDEWQSWTSGLCARVQERATVSTQEPQHTLSGPVVATPTAVRTSIRPSPIGLARTQSDNITGAAVPFDRDLPAPIVPSSDTSISISTTPDRSSSSTPTLGSMLAAVAAAQQASGFLGTPTAASFAHSQAKTHVSLSSAAAAIGLGHGSPAGSPSPTPSPRRPSRGPSGAALNNREVARRKFSASRR